MSLSVKAQKRDIFDKFNSLRGGLVALYESSRVAALHEGTLGPLWDLDGMVFSEQPVQIGHAFDVTILEMRVFGMPLVSPHAANVLHEKDKCICNVTVVASSTDLEATRIALLSPSIQQLSLLVSVQCLYS